MAVSSERYTAVAIVLHWAIAAAILFQLPLGFIMHQRAEAGDLSQGVFAAYQLHKSIGLTVLALTLARLGWRLTHKPPPLAAGMPAWERFAARATHWGFYALTLALPLTGWLYVSAGWSVHENASLAVPTRWFGLFEVPHLFSLPQAPDEVRAQTAQTALNAHAALAYAAIALAALHVAAALKHHFFDRDATLTHMVPGLRAPVGGAAPRSIARSAVLGLGFAGIAASLIAALLSVADLAAPRQAPSQFDLVEQETAPPVSAPDLTAPPEATPLAPAPPAQPGAWIVDQRASALRFAYVYADESGESRFNGRFTRWRADIRFDPDALDDSAIVVRIETASAQTGAALHDNALPTAAWFNSSAHPSAEFRATRVTARGGDAYTAHGALTLRGQTRHVDLPFTLTISGDRAAVSGSTRIDRRDFGVGNEDAGDDLISREVEISVRVEATRAP
jgi:cytochrome b561/polyisoprenoid-binding protein YceI